MIYNVSVRQGTGHKTILLISVLSHNLAVKHIIGHLKNMLKYKCVNVNIGNCEQVSE